MVPGQNPFAMQKAVLENRVKNRASWLMYAAGLSIINRILVILHIPFYFLGGLGIASLLVDIVNAGAVASLILTLIPAAAFAVFGMQATKRQLWAFYVGIALYALDGVLLLLAFRDYLSVAFHGYVLYRMFEGLSAARQLKTLEETAARQMHFAGAPQPGAWPPPPSQGYPVPGAYPQPGQPQAGYGQPPQPGWGQQPAAPQAPAQAGDWANQPGGIVQPPQPRNLDGS